jgi:hypothetical protein
MSRAPRHKAWTVLALACAAAGPGCNQFGSRQRLEEGRRTIQALRSDNDRLKDQLLTLRNENHDLSERAVDDSRRIAALSESVDDYRGSIHAYQARQDELKESFRALRDGLPAAVRSALADSDRRVVLDDREPADTPPTPETPLRVERRKPIHTEHDEPQPSRDGWSPVHPDAP